MNYTYKLLTPPQTIDGTKLEIRFVLRSDGMNIPFDPANTDYATYLKWLEEGNTPEPADPVPEPTQLTPQEKLANAGLSVEELKTLLGLK